MVAAFLFVAPAFSQKARLKSKAVAKPIVFAVLDGGKRVDPIVSIDGTKLVDFEIHEGSPSKAFGAEYYKPRTPYSLIFGGAPDGFVTIVKSNVGTECGGGSADTTARPLKAKLGALVMGLATNVKMDTNVSGYRRRPTAEERTEIEKLVRSEFTKNGASTTAVKNLKYHNLTALDVDGDDKAEFVGSYWIAPTSNERRLLFFIAEGDANGKIVLSMSDHSIVKPDDVMSGEVKDLDTGVGHELLLDVLDYANDGVKEIFTIGQAFEGNNYYVYQRTDGKWTKVYESYNYRCAF